jgi:predicted HNH restriction endonuclease
MDENTARMVRATQTLDGLNNIEANAKRRGELSEELKRALQTQAGEICRPIVISQTGLDVDNLTPAEAAVLEAVGLYLGLKRLDKSNANRTIEQLKNRGFLGAAEASVEKAKPTPGYELFRALGRPDLTYEQIIVDHPEEFTKRAQWHARRTLGLPNEMAKAPTSAGTPIQEQTLEILDWLKSRRDPSGRIRPFANADAAAVLGWSDLAKFGRAFGNLQSRLDFACYRVGVPPLGLAADKPFENAWSQEDRDWSFPVQTMQAAAQSRAWTDADLRSIAEAANELPGRAHVAWRQEITLHEADVWAWAEGLTAEGGRTGNAVSSPDEPSDVAPGEPETKRRNPPWMREELILALDLYFRLRETTLPKDAPEIIELSQMLVQMQGAQEDADPETYRNEAGVYMKLMNFRRLDPKYTGQGQTGLSRGNSLEPGVWDEFAGNPEALARAVAAIRSGVAVVSNQDEAPYWVFVCNPKKWAIDRFLNANIERDTWGVRPSDRARFAPGQLAIVRVGVDRRSRKELAGAQRLEPGIYALCEVESVAFGSTGASEAFWSEDAVRAPGWPTVKVRYLRTYLERPLTIERLRAEARELSPLLLGGFQAASFPIPESDFRQVLALLEVTDEDLAAGVPVEGSSPDDLAALEEKYRRASPQVKERVSRSIERGETGARVKRACGFRCQICAGLGLPSLGLVKPSGEPYVEAHHVMPVAQRQIGSLAASNIMIVCANHHRQLHYGGVTINIETTTFELELDGVSLRIARPGLSLIAV